MALVSGAGAVLGAAIVIVASPLMPIGPARLADLHPGDKRRCFCTRSGACSTVIVVTTALVAWPAWRRTARRGAERFRCALDKRSTGRVG